MGSVSDWFDLMPATVTVAPYISSDSYGTPSYGPAVTYRARVTYKQHLVRVSETETKVSRGICYMGTDKVFGVRDQVTLPDGTQPDILVSTGESDEDGPLYSRLDFA